MSTPKSIEVTVSLQLGGTETVNVNQITVSQFPAAYSAYESEDEMRLVEIACGRPPRWCDTVAVESYSELVAALYDVNSTGFFGYAGRRSAMRAVKAEVANKMRGGSPGSTTSRT